MRAWWVAVLLCCIGADAAAFKSTAALSYVGYEDAENDLRASGELSVKLHKENIDAEASLIFLYSRQYDAQRYIDLQTLYGSYTHDVWRIEAGKRLLYWGELEGYNIADIFNPKNYLYDPFDQSAKRGSWSVAVQRYFGEDVLEVGAKLYEEEREFGNVGDPFYPLPLPYDASLQHEKSRYDPSLYLSYTLSSDVWVESESRMIFWHGYDNKRYFMPDSLGRLHQYAYRVDKALFLSHVVYNDTIFKCEAAYTWVNDDRQMSDYWQFGIGAERSVYDIAGTDVTVYAEYYRYGYADEGKVEQVDISELYNDDLFLAAKLNVNDPRSSEIKAGMLYDFTHDEKLFKVELRTRVQDSLVVEGALLRLIPSQETLLGSLNERTRLDVTLSYSF